MMSHFNTATDSLHKGHDRVLELPLVDESWQEANEPKQEADDKGYLQQGLDG